MLIKMEELKLISQILINKTIEVGFKEVDIDTDNYWIIASDDREDFRTSNPKVCVGSINDDVESIRKVLDGTNPPTTIDFDRFASIIIAIGERISRSDTPFI